MALRLVTSEEDDEFGILGSKTATHKVAAQVGLTPPTHIQQALERLMLRDWLRLIDICPIAMSENGTDVRLMRIFRVMPEALAWYETEKARRAVEMAPTTETKG